MTKLQFTLRIKNIKASTIQKAVQTALNDFYGRKNTFGRILNIKHNTSAHTVTVTVETIYSLNELKLKLMTRLHNWHCRVVEFIGAQTFDLMDVLSAALRSATKALVRPVARPSAKPQTPFGQQLYVALRGTTSASVSVAV